MSAPVRWPAGKLLFAGLALLFALLGIALLVFRATLGLEPSQAALIAAALLLTAAADALILARWDRLAVSRAKP